MHSLNHWTISPVWPLVCFLLFVYFCFERGFSCSSGRPQTDYVTWDNLELLCLSSTEIRDTHMPTHQVYVVLGIELRALYMLGKHFTNWTTSPASWVYYLYWKWVVSCYSSKITIRLNNSERGLLQNRWMSRKIRTVTRSWFIDVAKDREKDGCEAFLLQLLLILFTIWNTFSHSFWKVLGYRYALTCWCRTGIAFFPWIVWQSSLIPSVCFLVLASSLTSVWYIMGSHRCLTCGFSELNDNGEIGTQLEL